MTALKTYKRKPAPTLQPSGQVGHMGRLPLHTPFSPVHKSESEVLTCYIADELQELENTLTIHGQATTSIEDGVTTIKQDIVNINNTVGQNTAAITSEANTRVAADSALSSLITTVQADVTTNSAAVVTEATARANADSAEATARQAVQANVDTVAAAVVTEASARATADSALTQSINTVSASVGTVAASVTAEATARANADGVLEAKYGVSLNSNGYITGFSQNNNGTTGTFKILADKFTIIDPAAAGSGLAGTQVFDITNGIVTMEAAHIKNLTVGNVDGTISATSVFSGSASKTFGPTSAGYVTLLEVDCPANSGAKSHTPLINMIFDGAFATDTAYVKLEYATLTGGSPSAFTAIQTLRHKTAAGGNSWTTIPVIGSAPSTTSAVRFKVSIQMYADNGTGSTSQSRTGTAHWSGTTVGIV